MKKIFTVLFSLIILHSAFSQSIEKVQAERGTNGVIVVNYNLDDEKSKYGVFLIQLQYLDKTGNWVEIKKHLKGDIGWYQKPGIKKQIVWEPFNDENFTEVTESQLKVIATPIYYKNFILTGDVYSKVKINEKDTTIYIKPFYLSGYEVTYSEFENFVKTNNYISDAEKGLKCYQIGIEGDLEPTNENTVSWRNNPKGSNVIEGDINKPVVFVSPNDAEQYAKSISCRLPYEYEWEAAASCNQFTEYNPQQLDSMINFNSNVRKRNYYDIGTMKPNQCGFYDMLGNVSEIVKSSDFSKEPKYLQKGGSFNFDKENVSIKFGGNISKNHSIGDIGFRVAKEVSF